MAETIKEMFEAKLGRYQATIALEPTDRMPVAATGVNYFAEVYCGYSSQEVMYDINR